MSNGRSGLTVAGKLVVASFVLGLAALGGYLILRGSSIADLAKLLGRDSPSEGDRAAGSASDGSDAPPATVTPLAEAPRLDPPQAYTPADGIIDLELSEYAGYAGLIVANGGLEPNEGSLFFRKHGFKVRIRLSEEESWSALNAGRMAASATTVDVLAVYGRQFQVQVPVQIGFSRGADGVVTRSDVQRVNALAGKVLAASQFTEADFFLRYLAQGAGLTVVTLAGLDATPKADAVNLVYGEDAFQAGDLFLHDVVSGGGRLAGCVTWAPKTTEVAAASGGRAHVLATNRNLLVIADVLVVNAGFAQANPNLVAGLVAGLLEGNQMVRSAPATHLAVIGQAFGWTEAEAREELTKVHLSNVPENLAFFSGAIDTAGSFSGIFQSAVLAYGPTIIKDPPSPERFVDLAHLQALDQAGTFRDQKLEIAPIRSGVASAIEGNPLLTRDIRFYFLPNLSQLDLTQEENLRNLAAIKEMLAVSPGSTVLLRGHVDTSMVEQIRKQGGEGFLREMALKAMKLSKERADEVAKQVMQLHHVAPDRLEAVGRGWEEPLGTVQEENRRVEAQWFTLE